MESPNNEVRPVRKDTTGDGLNKQIEMLVIRTKIESAGTNRLILRSENPLIKSLKSLLVRPNNDEVITYPDITKKMSTPRYPPGRRSLLKWLMITATTANALRPSISGLYFPFAVWVCVALMPLGGGSKYFSLSREFSFCS